MLGLCSCFYLKVDYFCHKKNVFHCKKQAFSFGRIFFTQMSVFPDSDLEPCPMENSDDKCHQSLKEYDCQHRGATWLSFVL